jgi:hypothetical protein
MGGSSFVLRRAIAALLASLSLAGCAGLPSAVERPTSTTRVAPADARLDLMRRAQVSFDLQTYMIGNDATFLFGLLAPEDFCSD